MHFLRDCLLLVKMKFALVGLALGISLSGHLAWPQTQVPQKPKPDDVTQFIHVEPEALGEWVQQEFEDLGHALEVSYLEPPNQEGFAFSYDVKRQDAGALSGSETVDLIFQDCKASRRAARSEPLLCKTVKLRAVLDDHKFCDSDRLFSSGYPPLGFQIYEAANWCVIAIGTILIAEGPLFLIENIEWLLEVAKRLKQNPDTPDPIIKGYHRPQNSFEIEKRWEQLRDYSTIRRGDIPEVSELVSFQRADHDFIKAVDRFAHYRLDPKDLKYDSYFWSHIVLGDLIFYMEVNDCLTDSCKEVGLGARRNYRHSLPYQTTELNSLIYHLDEHEVLMVFLAPQRGISPAFLKALLREYHDVVEPLAGNFPANQRDRTDDDWRVESTNITEVELECWNHEEQIPQMGFVKSPQGNWTYASSSCPTFELREGAVPFDISQHLLLNYVKALDRTFQSEEWNEIRSILFISDPNLRSAGTYFPPEGEYNGIYYPSVEDRYPGIMFNLTLENNELESPLFFQVLVHEFAHQIFYSGIYSNVGDEDKFEYHPCVEKPNAKTCEDFEGPIADYLRQFWWEHKRGFSSPFYSGLYRIIDDSGAFVSEYAATNAHEDFAETFTAAVFDEYPIFNREGKIVSEKLDFFLKDGGPYTELVQQIRSNFYDTFEIWSGKDLYTNMTFTNRLVKEAKEKLRLE